MSISNSTSAALNGVAPVLQSSTSRLPILPASSLLSAPAAMIRQLASKLGDLLREGTAQYSQRQHYAFGVTVLSIILIAWLMRLNSASSSQYQGMEESSLSSIKSRDTQRRRHSERDGEYQSYKDSDERRFIRHQTEFEPPPADFARPPPQPELPRLLQDHRACHTFNFPRSNDQFKQGIWSLDLRLQHHECSNPNLFVTMEDSSKEEKVKLHVWGKGDVVLYVSDSLAKNSCSPLRLKDVLFIRNSHHTTNHKLSLPAIEETMKLCSYHPSEKVVGEQAQLREKVSNRWLGDMKKEWLTKTDKAWILQTCSYNTMHDKQIYHVECPNHGWWPILISWYDHALGLFTTEERARNA